MTRNIFISFEDGSCVMAFTENEKLTPEIVEKVLRNAGKDVIETHYVRDDELEFYCYEPYWFTPKIEERYLELASRTPPAT